MLLRVAGNYLDVCDVASEVWWNVELSCECCGRDGVYWVVSIENFLFGQKFQNEGNTERENFIQLFQFQILGDISNGSEFRAVFLSNNLESYDE